MRILFISPSLPVPANNGQAIRTLSIVRALRSLGHEVTFISFAQAGTSVNSLPLSQLCERLDIVEGGAKLTNGSRRVDYVGRIACLLRARSHSFVRFRSRTMRMRIQWLLKTTRFDLIVCDSPYVLINVPATDVPIILNCHNVEHLIVGRYAEIEKKRARKWYARIEARMVRQAEQRACGRALAAMACSDYDRELLEELRPGLPVFVVPNAVDTERNATGCAMSESAPILLFQGGMDWYPNRDAVEFFARRILPLIRAVCPDVKFVVAGRNPPADFVQEFSGDPHIEITGTVPDMAPYIAAAIVVVVPLRMGSGTRIKILEACAAGKPVISTRVGAEGLQLDSEKEIVLADDPAEFARSVIALLRDPARRGEIGAAARSAIVERYSERALKRSIQSALSRFSNTQAPAKAVHSWLQESA